jgi:hypothetical protein
MSGRKRWLIHPPMKKMLLGVAILVLALPVAAMATLLLLPFWRWFEARTQVESVGHSGPADWCFGAVYLLTVLVSFGVWFWVRHAGRMHPSDSPEN